MKIHAIRMRRLRTDVCHLAMAVGIRANFPGDPPPLHQWAKRRFWPPAAWNVVPVRMTHTKSGLILQ